MKLLLFLGTLATLDTFSSVLAGPVPDPDEQNGLTARAEAAAAAEAAHAAKAETGVLGINFSDLFASRNPKTSDDDSSTESTDSSTESTDSSTESTDSSTKSTDSSTKSTGSSKKSSNSSKKSSDSSKKSNDDDDSSSNDDDENDDSDCFVYWGTTYCPADENIEDETGCFYWGGTEYCPKEEEEEEPKPQSWLEEDCKDAEDISCASCRGVYFRLTGKYYATKGHYAGCECT